MRDGFTKQKIICVLLVVLLCSGCGTGNQQEEPVSSVESQPAMEESESESTEIKGEKEKPKEEIKEKTYEGFVSIDLVGIEGRTQEETELIHKILATDKEEFEEFLTTDWEFPHEQEGVLITAYDFTGDGKDEIIVSKFYVNVSAPLSYNYVYDQKGRRILDFIGSHPLDIAIIAGWDGEGTFLLYDKNHYGSHTDANIYTEIRCENGVLTEQVLLMEYDCRPGGYEEKDGYYIFKNFTQEEEERLWRGYLGAGELTKIKKYVWEDEDVEKYRRLFETTKTTGVSMIGVILYGEEDGFIEFD